VAMKFKVFLICIFNFPSVNLQQFPMIVDLLYC